jgi:signal transduction histidine kinase
VTAPPEPDAASLADAADLERQLLDIIFGEVPMGLALFDRDARLQRCNSTWRGFFTHYLQVPDGYVMPGRTLAELLPDSAATVEPLSRRALAGETIRQLGLRLEQDGVVNYWDVVMAPTYSRGEIVGFVDVVTDATARVVAYELLERRIAAFAAVASSMTVDQPLQDTLCTLAQTARSVTDAEACAVLIVDAETNEIAVFASDGLPPAYGDAVAESWRRGVRSPSRDALEHQQLTEVPDARSRGLANPLYEPLYPYLRDATWDDMVIVPLDSRGRSHGVMQYYHRRGRSLDADERSFLTALADQAAVAVANAALYARSEHDATVVERQRLARELHDSVSQALFSMTLHARTAERQLAVAGVLPDAPPVETVRRLAELTQGALAEMRALIFELRPGALTEEGLVTALTRQAAALSAREGTPIRVDGPVDRPQLSPQSEEHLYRLTLEALHNAVKHAQAGQIAVDITSQDDGSLLVRIADDGVGFDPQTAHPGHMGQSTMAERAAAIGAALHVDSAPGAGCAVTVRVPAQS